MEQYIEVQPREQLGKGHNRRLRKQGMVPGIVYGGDRGPIPIAISEKDVWNMLHAETGENTVRLLRLAGTDRQRHVMIKDYQMDPITRKILHADFYRVDVDQEVDVTVPIRIEGTPFGVKNEGGMMDFVHREVGVRCKVTDIPAEIVVDVTPLHIGDTVRVSDLELASGEFTDPEDTLIVKVDVMRTHKMEAETEVEEEEFVEAAETAETEEAEE